MPDDKLKFHLVEDRCEAKIRVVGVGGGGGNAVNRMIETGIQGVEFIAVNTDRQALRTSLAEVKVAIGGQLTKGLGSGGRPETGRLAAEEDTEKLVDLLQGADMVFLTAGLGGGTGTGASPILARLASELDVLAIAIVTLPFEFEGKVRARQADEGLAAIRASVDTVIAIPNERLLQTVNLDTSLQDAFKMADDVLRQGVQGVSDLITKPGLINLDFADVKSVMKGMGMAFMGTGIASGENRALEAAQKAISSPLLVDTSIKGAHGVLINITGGRDMTLHEVSKASQLIHSQAAAEANLFFGTVIDESMKEMIKVTVIATGFQEAAAARDEARPAAAAPPTPVPLRKTPPPFPVYRETPPYLFEPGGARPPVGPTPPEWDPAAWGEKQWESYESPAFIRKPKPGSVRKAHDVS